MLSVAGLVNYIGKIDLPLNDQEAQNTGIAIKPVLLRKGNSKMAIYGVGNVKDQRLHYELRSNRVRMFMPRDKHDWFNILVLHQNRCVLVGLTYAIAHKLSQTNPARVVFNMLLNSSFQRACSTTALTLSFGDTSTTVEFHQNLLPVNDTQFLSPVRQLQHL